MTEFLRELMYPSDAAGLTLDELCIRLRPFMYVPLGPIATMKSSSPGLEQEEVPAIVDSDPLPPIVVSVPPVVVPPISQVSVGFTSILWCAYTVAHGGRQLNIPLALLAREERKIREDCVNRVSPAAVKQRFGFLTLSQIQSLLQEVQQTKHKTETPATWYIWAVYYAATLPTVHLVYGRLCISIPCGSGSSDLTVPLQILYDKTQGTLQVVDNIDVSGLVPITNLLKPINGIGSYTLLDLKQMANQMDLPVAPSAKKTALYESISEYIRTAIV